MVNKPRELRGSNGRCWFEASRAQWKRSRAKKTRDKARFSCSPACKTALLRMQRKEVPLRGPCPQCGEPFRSRAKKIFCGMECYRKSDRYKATQERLRKLNAEKCSRVKIECRNCGAPVSTNRSSGRKYCSKACYRKYQAGRFDRWIANPETLNLIQNYDEFLCKDELPCVFPGCEWKGSSLSLHMNFEHGITADDFKRAAGFNLKTGVVSMPMHEMLSSRDYSTRREHLDNFFQNHGNRDGRTVKIRDYKSRERSEHLAKASAEAYQRPGSERSCKGCGVDFETSTGISHNQKFCTLDCRSAYYKAEKGSGRVKKVRCD